MQKLLKSMISVSTQDVFNNQHLNQYLQCFGEYLQLNLGVNHHGLA